MKNEAVILQNMLTKVCNGISVLLLIVLFELVSIQIYRLPSSGGFFIIWIISLAASSLYLGYLSDRFSRKSCLLFTLVSGFLLVLLIGYFGFSRLFVLLLGLTFNPTPIARASIVDNFPHTSKVQLIVVTFIAQFLPWCAFSYLSEIPQTVFFIIMLISMLINALFFAFFRDLRDAKVHFLAFTKVIHVGNRSKVYLTMSACFIGQVVFFLSDARLDELSSNSTLYSLLGLGSLIGTSLGLLYRKTPHLSVLTLSYGMGLLFSVVPLFSTISSNLDNLDFTYQTMLVANLGGFYLPFVYDAVLSSTSPAFRGTLCGVIELLISMASVFALLFFMIFADSNIYLFTFISALFIIAMFLQRIGERKLT